MLVGAEDDRAGVVVGRNSEPKSSEELSNAGSDSSDDTGSNTGVGGVEGRKGSDTVIGPVPIMSQSRLYSGKVSFNFFTKSKLGLLRPESRWETFEG